MYSAKDANRIGNAQVLYIPDGPMFPNSPSASTRKQNEKKKRCEQLHYWVVPAHAWEQHHIRNTTKDIPHAQTFHRLQTCTGG
jgi:hypothetical protein